MRQAISRQHAGGAIHNSTCLAPTKQPTRSQSTKMVSSYLSRSSPSQFSSFIGAKMFLPQLYVPKRGPPVAGQKVGSALTGSSLCV